MPLKKLSQLIALSPATRFARGEARRMIKKGKAHPKGSYQRQSAGRAARQIHNISQIGSGVNLKK